LASKQLLHSRPRVSRRCCFCLLPISRVDVSEGTAQTYRVELGRLLPRLGATAVDEIGAQTVADLVAELHTAGLKKQTIRKTVSVLAMILDHAGVQPNPARDKLTVRLPREERRELRPPTAEHVEAVVRLLPPQYRLPALILDSSGMRIGELEALTWGDVDEPRQRWRVSGAVAKTGRARWVPVPPVLFKAVTALVARDDRAPERPVFQGFGGDRFRTAITRACTAAGVPTSRRTTFATVVSRCCTWAGCRGRGSASSSATMT
jgi:integrase